MFETEELSFCGRFIRCPVYQPPAGNTTKTRRKSINSKGRKVRTNKSKLP